ncbi:MAG: AAA family ATPase, partial [Bacteroidales bacterium]
MERTDFYDPGQKSPPPPPPSPPEKPQTAPPPQEPELTDGTLEPRLIWWDDLRQSEIPRPADVVEGLIPGSSLVMFSGDGGIGKSYILLEMALLVAQGLPWLRMDTTPLPVLIIDLENREW